LLLAEKKSEQAKKKERKLKNTGCSTLKAADGNNGGIDREAVQSS